MERYWSRFADGFDERQTSVAGEELIQSIKKKLSEQKQLGSLLEFGCGNGNYTRGVLDEADSITATDYSQEMVDRAKERFAHNRRVIVEQADCRGTVYKSESFDTVLIANLIHIIDHPDAVIREAARLLRTGGKLIVTSFTAEGMTLKNKLGLLIRYLGTFGMFPKGTTPFTTQSLSRLIKQEGFSISEAALLGKKTHSLFITATKSAET